MADPKKPKPEILPPAPDVEPERRPVEIPQDKTRRKRMRPKWMAQRLCDDRLDLPRLQWITHDR
jgi:hypothetical protein